MKTSILVLVTVLLAISQAHKHSSANEEVQPIYQPFEDVPTPDQNDIEERDGMSDEEKQQQVE